LVLDGEIAVPDEKGVTHIDALSTALRQRRYESFAYFNFDLLHLDGHDVRGCAIEDRKVLLPTRPASPLPRSPFSASKNGPTAPGAPSSEPGGGARGFR
jgi:bifunctional non-homologous end joining protein LigD